MGCLSTKVVEIIPGKQLEDYLTGKEMFLVKDTWMAIEDDLTDTGYILFKRLFEKHQDLKKLFGRLMVTTISGDEVIDDNKLRNHGNAVMNGLGAAVESLEDSIFLTNVLITIGEKHAQYHVTPEMIGYFWHAIRVALKEKLKDEFTEEAESAWKHVFEYMASKIVEGITKAGKG